jgi:hypothetical protein
VSGRLGVVFWVVRKTSTYNHLDPGGRRDQLLDLGLGLFQRGVGDVGHKDVGALLGEEDGRLEADAAVSRVSVPFRGGEVRKTVYPPAPVMMAFLPARRPRGSDDAIACVVYVCVRVRKGR